MFLISVIDHKKLLFHGKYGELVCGSFKAIWSRYVLKDYYYKLCHFKFVSIDTGKVSLKKCNTFLAHDIFIIYSICKKKKKLQ